MNPAIAIVRSSELAASPVRGCLLTPREVAERLAVSTSMVRKLTALGDLPVIRIGRLPRYDEREVYAFVERHRAGGR